MVGDIQLTKSGLEESLTLAGIVEVNVPSSPLLPGVGGCIKCIQPGIDLQGEHDVKLQALRENSTIHKFGSLLDICTK